MLICISFNGYSQEADRDARGNKIFFGLGYKYNNLRLSEKLAEENRGTVSKSLITASVGKNFNLVNDVNLNFGLEVFSSLPKRFNEEENTHTGITLLMDLKWTLLDRSWGVSPGFVIGYSAERVSLVDKKLKYEDLENNALLMKNNYILVGPEVDFKLSNNTDLPLTITLGAEFPIVNNKWKYTHTNENIVKEDKGKLYLKMKYRF